ncbi:hypothetical protein PJP07_30755, partial [Mycobacterium kansasii]
GDNHILLIFQGYKRYLAIFRQYLEISCFPALSVLPISILLPILSIIGTLLLGSSAYLSSLGNACCVIKVFAFEL